ncbi:Sodium-driven chloride bicarbonate exchanger [Durusdinium trenchii]|uniref:Sodium-driven chloride bicarbonate exchanger n=1 Tax=Durusdinium trenchii TaxID=1381693 RepID=A0ABP0S2V2_9DINO
MAQREAMVLEDVLQVAPGWEFPSWKNLQSLSESQVDHWSQNQQMVKVELAFLRTVSFLDGESCARCAQLAPWAHSSTFLAVAQENVRCRRASAGLLLSRWLDQKYCCTTPFQQQRDLEIAAQHFETIAGRYSLLEYDCTLDIQPCGSFRNYGSQHEMVGQAAIAGVMCPRDVPASSLADVPKGMQVRYICLLDRWYRRAVMDGREMTPEDLEFCGPGYQTYSVHAWLEPLPGSSFTDGAFMENRPRPTAQDGWLLEDNPLRHPWHRSLPWKELEKLLREKK